MTRFRPNLEAVLLTAIVLIGLAVVTVSLLWLFAHGAEAHPGHGAWFTCSDFWHEGWGPHVWLSAESACRRWFGGHFAYWGRAPR